MQVTRVDRENVAIGARQLIRSVEAEIGIAVGESRCRVAARIQARPQRQRTDLRRRTADLSLIGDAGIGRDAVDVAGQIGIDAEAAEDRRARRPAAARIDVNLGIDPRVGGQPERILAETAGENWCRGRRWQQGRSGIGEAPRRVSC